MSSSLYDAWAQFRALAAVMLVLVVVIVALDRRRASRRSDNQPGFFDRLKAFTPENFSPRSGFTVPQHIQQDAASRISEEQRLALAQFVLTYWSFIKAAWRPSRSASSLTMQAEIAKVFVPMSGAGGATSFSAQQLVRNLAAHPEFLTYCIRYADVIVKAYRHFNHYHPFRIGASWLPADTTIIALQDLAYKCAAASKMEAEVRTTFDMSHEEAVRLLRYAMVMCFGSGNVMEPTMSELWTKQMLHLRQQIACVIVQLFEIKEYNFTADHIEPHIDRLAREPELMRLLVSAADIVSHHYDHVSGTSDWHALDPGTALVGKLVARKSLTYI